ncbi:hypothetical protein ACRRTK_019805 [Alexandromys fortis]
MSGKPTELTKLAHRGSESELTTRNLHGIELALCIHGTVGWEQGLSLTLAGF